MGYVVYNVLYRDGKKVGKPFKAHKGKTLAEAKRKGEKYNLNWNASERKEGSKFRSRIAYIKKTGVAKKKTRKPSFHW